MKKKKLLWVGHAGVESGFGRVTHNVLAELSKTWEVACLGVGHRGDPHNHPFRIYPAVRWMDDGDEWGTSRLEEIIMLERPDVIAVMMEPWNLAKFVQGIRIRAANSLKLLAYAIIDGENVRSEDARWLAQYNHVVFPTMFAWQQAVKAGFVAFAGASGASASSVPHGVDPAIFRPIEKYRARDVIGISAIPNVGKGSFLFGNVNVNQPRKRLDLSVECFAGWYHRRRQLDGEAPDAFLYLHTNPKDEAGFAPGQLSEYFGIKGRIITPAEDVRIPEQMMACVYSALDVQITTTAGEGWGLTTMEGMACGVPQIVPQYAALGQFDGQDPDVAGGGWVDGMAARFVPVGAPYFTAHQANAMRRAPIKKAVVDAMDAMWLDKKGRDNLGRAARRWVLRKDFRWSNIAAGFTEALDSAIASPGVDGKAVIEGATKAPAAGPSGAELAVKQ